MSFKEALLKNFLFYIIMPVYIHYIIWRLFGFEWFVFCILTVIALNTSFILKYINIKIRNNNGEIR